MNIPKYKLSKIYIFSTIASLVILLGYYCHRFFKYYNEEYANNFNLFALLIFSASIILLLYIFSKEFKNKIIFILLFIILVTSTLFSYDFIISDIYPDCECNFLVGKRFREQGLASFLKNYHKPTLYKIKKTPQEYEKFLHYNNKLKLNYEELLDNIENEASDIILSDNTLTSRKINWRIGKHPPLSFIAFGFANIFSNDGYFSRVVVPSNLVAILYLISLYVFLGLFFKQEEYKSKLLILIIILFLPTFLQQSARNTNELILGVMVTWALFFLLRNTDNKINYNDLLLGFVYSVAVLIKLTSLTLLLPITLYYLIYFKYKSFPKLVIFITCFLALPLFLYVVFEYDMLLNLLTGIVDESVYKAGLNASIISNIAWYFFYDQYNLGIPFVLLLITHIFKIKQNSVGNDVLISYMLFASFFMLSFFLWHSGLSRHLSGFIPLTIPLLVYIFKNCEEKFKLVSLTVIFLFFNNVLILIHNGVIMADFLGLRYWSY